MLPRVSEEVASQVMKIMRETDRISDSWLDMAENNKELFENITDIAAVASVHKREKGEMFLRGAMFVWECLRVQDEVDDMNQEWGI
tara:strand:+ start:250 stop:507 length:258 start_codon:yes stop_codon:yes gene_type:complete